MDSQKSSITIFVILQQHKTFDFSTLYTTIPHAQLKDRLHHLIKQSFFYKNGNRRYKFLVLGYNNSYFVKNHTESSRKYTEDDFIKMLDFLINNIFVEFGGFIFQQTIGIPMGTNCAPLLADLFLYSYEAEFIQKEYKGRYFYKNSATKSNFIKESPECNILHLAVHGYSDKEEHENAKLFFSYQNDTTESILYPHEIVKLNLLNDF